MSKALVKYQRNLPAKSALGGQGLIILLVIAVLVIWFLTKRQSAVGQYLNKEAWDIQYSPDGLPVKIVISRNATRS